MHKFHYNYIGVNYGNSAKLLFKDTDSLVYEIKTDDVYEGFYEDKRLFEFSDYPKDRQFYDPVNKNIISEFVGLKSKMYSLVRVDGEVIKKTKSVNKNVVESIRHKEYVDVLFGRGLVRRRMKRIKS